MRRNSCVRMMLEVTLAALLLASGPCSPTNSLRAADLSETEVATRPWASLWVSSIGRSLAACDLIFESVERPDLAESLEDRLGNYRAFGGIDRKRPLGLMWTWNNIESAATIFLPVGQLEELMKTATFDVVGFHKVTDDRYEIERPGSPYHVLLRSGYALFGESVTAMQALRVTPDQLTKSLRDKYDIVLMLDLRQVPRASKELWIDELKNQVEPWLQPQDGEPVETATMRRAIGSALLSLSKRLVLDVRTITLGGRLDPEQHQLIVELIVQSEPGSELAGGLKHLVSRRSEFSALINSQASAGLAINWPLQSLGKELLGPLVDEPLRGSRIDAGIQIVGQGWGQTTVIAGLHGPEAAALNAAIPRLIVRLEKSGQFTTVTDNADIYRGVVLHSVVPREVPQLLGQLTGPEVEVLIGQGKQTIWFAAGNPETLPARLQQAIDTVEDSPARDRANSLVNGRFAVGKWPSIIAPGEAVPTPEADKHATEDPSDGIRLTIEPTGDALKIRLVAEKGILKLIGLDWARQVDEINAAK